MKTKSLLSTASLALAIAAFSASAQAQIAIGHLADYSGGTSDVGTPYGQAVADTFAWVNKNGGVGGKQINVDTNDYGYQVPRAIALYKKWSAPDSKVAAIMGWGTADTEALTGFLAQDKIPDLSGSYAAALTDPEGVSGKAKPAPYNFFYGPSYSDSLRAMLMWAAEDWKAKGKSGKSRNSCTWAPTTPIRTHRRPPAKPWRRNSASRCCRRWYSHSRRVTTVRSA
ncbi:ABC-type branched-subunit amino acid transport system substrate-binding protein [Bradyrhizobium sp. LB13.1]